MGISEDGQDCRFYVNIPLTRFQGFDIAEVGGEFFAFATGKIGRNARFVSVNLNTGELTHD